jgi:hypothetical protein
MTSLYSVSVLWTRFLFRFLHASLTISEKVERSTKKSVKVQEIAVDFFRGPNKRWSVILPDDMQIEYQSVITVNFNPDYIDGTGTGDQFVLCRFRSYIGWLPL